MRCSDSSITFCYTVLLASNPGNARELFQFFPTHVAILAINQIQMRLRESQLDEHVTPKGT